MENGSFYKTYCQASPVFAGDNLREQINEFLSPFYTGGGVFILADRNTEKYCLPLLLQLIPDLKISSLYAIPPGEESKDLSELLKIWDWMMNSGITRESILINLGGGVVSDLGGFAAATFKRGIRYINIPTTSIGMVDAAIGGKTGINFQKVKNQLGAFCFPAAVFIMPLFLETLPERHLKSGVAELIKASLLSGNTFWEKVRSGPCDEKNKLAELIFDAVSFKCKIVGEDPYDQGLRRILNFGHTIGHALESFYNGAGPTEILHGEAVAAGIICESFLSFHYNGLTKAMLNDISSTLTRYFDFKPVEESYYFDLIKIMDHDKKRKVEKISFSLLESIGKPCYDIEVSEIEITLALNYFNQVVSDDQDHKK